MKHLIVDNFAGGGGASTGIEMAIGRSVDIAINHDPDAIAMHKANHPQTKHYCEDVWQVDPVEACDGNPVALAWFSPDCKHFSRAKGGKPVDKNIRGLAWVAIKWAMLVRPKVIMLENVPEIQTWGPLGEDGKPIKERAGETFDGFISALTSGISIVHPAYQEMCDALSIEPTSEMAQTLQNGLGYEVQYRTLKSCDYGAPTTRTRFYMIARCDGRPIVWPEPTHAPKDSDDVKQGRKLPYHTAAECIDWSIPAQSIFERKKPLAENTLRRIARGIQKFVIDNTEPFIVTVNHSGEEKRFLKRMTPNMREIYPLAENNIYESEIWKWAKELPVYNNYYKTNARCGCMYCPMASYINFAYLLKYYPENFDFMIARMRETEKLREAELGRPFSVTSSNPKYNADYLDHIIRTKWLKILNEKEEGNITLKF